MQVSNRYERTTATVLIVLGVALLVVVFFAAFSIVSDPGSSYDEWVPASGPAGPEASFTWSTSGTEATFEDTSVAGDAAVVRLEWDLGDGTESTESNPSHRYAGDGEYNVSLVVEDANGETSRASTTITAEQGASRGGEGAVGMNDVADDVVDTLDRAAKGVGVVILVIGALVVLTMVGGRFLRQGVQGMRTVPDKIDVRLRPKQLMLDMTETPPTEPVAIEASSEPPAVEDADRIPAEV